MNDHVTLMQIDCSVVNTSLVKLKSETLPESLRKSTNKDSISSAADSKVEKATDESNIEASLAKTLQNSSNNVSNNKISNSEVPSNDIFTHYLLSKNAYYVNNLENDSTKRAQRNSNIKLNKNVTGNGK